MVMMKTKYFLLTAVATLLLTTACNKVSPIGVLVAGTGVEDRVEMSSVYYQKYLDDKDFAIVEDEYSFIVGADSHVTTDPGRMDEMLKIGLDNDDMLYAHLGDIADTKPQYYIVLDSLLNAAKKRYVEKYYDKDENGYYTPKGEDSNEDNDRYTFDEIRYPFFPVVGNHDLTHNGWGMWSSIFHSSFYEIDIAVLQGGESYIDHFIFLDTASGTLGRKQVELIEDGILDGQKYKPYRHTFIFSHTNIFRPSLWQFASTFSREETYFLLNQFKKWNASMVFCGHGHAWDDREFDGVTYLTLDSMSEENSPNPGDYLVRVNVKKDGTISWEKVHMSYTKKNK